MVKLSASRIKTLLTCSWLYYTSYVLKLPSQSNEGAAQGSVVHYILECLIKRHRKEYVDHIIKTGNAFSIASISRLIKIHAKKLNVDNAESLSRINEFILTAIKQDFYCEGAIEVTEELEFDIKTDKYHIGGFIDKIAIYPDRIVVYDYKTSKSKDDMNFNVQGLMYALAIKHLYGKIPQVKFLYLKFKREIVSTASIDESKVNGFEEYLCYLSDYLTNFGINEAQSKFAYDNMESFRLCGKNLGSVKVDGSPAWICERRYPSTFFQAWKDDKLIKTTKNRKELDIYQEPEYIIKEYQYPGCPRVKDKLGFLWKN